MTVRKDGLRGAGAAVVLAICGVAVTPARALGAAGPASCDIYTEAFEGFGGPVDLDDGTFRVEWCTNGAAISAGSFCPTGGALRLASGTDDPRVLVVPSPITCATVTIEFDYSQFATTGTTLRASVVDATATPCAAPLGAVVASLGVTGGQCTTVSHTVDVAGGDAVSFTIDHGSSANAIFIDTLRLRVTGCCATGEHGCCETGAAGCDDPTVRDCVCSVDPFCCEVEWDALCVAEVQELECGTCGDPPVPCDAELFEDFGAVFEPGSICVTRPWTFEACEGNGPYLTSSGVCGAPGDQSMRFGTGFPYSAAITRCRTLPADVATTLAFSYTKSTGTLGPRVDVSIAGGTFDTIWQAPIIFEGGCVPVSIDLVEWAGVDDVRFRFSAGSSVDNGSRIDDIALIEGAPGAHGCCDTGAAGCSDRTIEACVCAIDPFCCETAWDELCVIGVEFYECGDCGICVDAFEPDLDAAALGPACAVVPESFVLCEGNGPVVAEQGACAAPGDATLVFASGAMRSSVVARCVSLVGAGSASLGFSYAKLDGPPGPLVETSFDAGATWEILWSAAAAPGPGCHSVCVDLSAFTGLPFVLFRFGAGTADGAGQSFDDIAIHRDTSCAPPADLDGDGVVAFGDLLMMIGQWGPCTGACPSDLSGDGQVGFADVLLLLGEWS